MKLELDFTLRRGVLVLGCRLTLTANATGLFGPSGAGKSTLLHVLAGLLRPDSGRISLDGETLFDSARGLHVPPHRRRVGIVFQDGRLFPHLTARENLLFGAAAATQPGSHASFDDIVSLLELAPLLDRRPRELSGGEQQRVALGRALLAQPRLLLLDEPLSALDQRLRRQILPLIRRVRDRCGVPILLVSHDLAEVLDVAPQLVLLERGRVAGCGTLPELIRQPTAEILLQEQGMVNVLPLTITQHAPNEGFTSLSLKTDTRVPAPEPLVLRGPLTAERPINSECHAVLRAADIALATQRIAGISMQNQLPGVVRDLVPAPDRMICVVDVGTALLVEATLQSVAALGLRVGGPVVCLFKTHALRYLDA